MDPRVVEGLGFFNHHQFFQSHEILEEVWKDTTGRDKDFYKGLIQAAVACYHWSKGNRPGALTLARSAANYLKRYEPSYLGIDVATFVRQFTEIFQWLRRHRLKYDAHLVPKIRW